MKNNKYGIALLGLGQYTTDQLVNCIQQSKHCFIAAAISTSVEKAKEWALNQKLENIAFYSNDEFETIIDNKEIDIVYIVLPNALHAEYTIKAARAGKHIICEKPMAISTAECDSMIKACDEAGVKLAIGYRLHFEPHNMEIKRFADEKVFGNVRKIIAKNGITDAEGWELEKSVAGGGPLVNVGIYCIQAARYATGLEPVYVTAQESKKNDPDKYKTVEESIAWQMHFDNDVLAECFTTYIEDLSELNVESEHGWARLQPAFGYDGIKGATSAGILHLGQVSDQTLLIDHVAECIKEDKDIIVSGEEGKKDIRIIEAIYKAARTRDKVYL
ncbi:MAG: Gfo/Idh/MocA family oxidoreductase [Ginsengibacter sp.]